MFILSLCYCKHRSRFGTKYFPRTGLSYNQINNKLPKWIHFYVIPSSEETSFQPPLFFCHHTLHITDYNLQFLMDLCVQLSMYGVVHLFLYMWVLILDWTINKLLLPHNLYSGTKNIPLFSQRPFYFYCCIGALFNVTSQPQ